MSDEKVKDVEADKKVEQKNSVPYNTQPAGLEKMLDGLFKKIDLKLPESATKWLSSNVWWLTAIGGVLSLWSAWSFWRVGHLTDKLVDWANEISKMYGVTTAVHHLGVLWYVSLAVIIVQAVILLLAVMPLKEQKKVGWNWLFYGMLVSIIAGVVELFVPGYGFASLFGFAIGSFIGGFFLFQLRAHFNK